jgi:hypothetical protein
MAEIIAGLLALGERQSGATWTFRIGRITSEYVFALPDKVLRCLSKKKKRAVF